MIPQSLKTDIIHLFMVQPEIERVILFGSRARGDADERSDIDLAIVAPKLALRSWLDIYFALKEEIDTLLQMDVIWWQQATEPLKERIRQEGIVLYERENHSQCTKP
ncbi:nucleotidyltransferase domain-containing protein [Anaerolineales bacterium HSG6]|nr:nucleotidyltransferase domain-containing protein [Anaerolineales bacterium HSG6]